MNAADPQLLACLETIASDERAQRTSFPGLRDIVAAAEPVIVGSTFRRAAHASKGTIVAVTKMCRNLADVHIKGGSYDDPTMVADLLDPSVWERLS